MKTMGEKIRDARIANNMTQAELSNATGISVHTIVGYERDYGNPRKSSILKIANALHVSARFLTDPDCIDPTDGIEENDYISKAISDRSEDVNISKLTEQSKILFAGGKYSMEEKMKFYEILTRAYLECRDEAERRKASEENK